MVCGLQNRCGADKRCPGWVRFPRIPAIYQRRGLSIFANVFDRPAAYFPMMLPAGNQMPDYRDAAVS